MLDGVHLQNVVQLHKTLLVANIVEGGIVLDYLVPFQNLVPEARYHQIGRPQLDLALHEPGLQLHYFYCSRISKYSAFIELTLYLGNVGIIFVVHYLVFKVIPTLNMLNSFFFYYVYFIFDLLLVYLILLDAHLELQIVCF